MKNNLFKLGIILLVLVVGMVGFVGCGSEEVVENDNNSANEPVVEDVVYVVGTDAAYPPFEKQEGGEIVGFDIDIIKAVAEAGGFNIEIKHTGWDPLFNGIDQEKVDLGISCITITEDRKLLYDFSNPYFEATQLIMVPVDSEVSCLADLEGLKIGVQSATTGDLAIQEAFGKTYEGLKGYDDMPSSIDDLLLGRVDAVVGDNAVLQEYLKTVGGDNYKLINDSSFEKEEYGIMVLKGNDELLEKINTGLQAIKDNGKYDEIFGNYFAN